MMKHTVMTSSRKFLLEVMTVHPLVVTIQSFLICSFKVTRSWVLNLEDASSLGDARYFSWGRELVSMMIEKTRE